MKDYGLTVLEFKNQDLSENYYNWDAIGLHFNLKCSQSIYMHNVK